MRILVAVPVYNEQQHVERVIAKIAQYAPQDVLVIDDGSTDDTPCLLAKQPVDVIRHKTNLGYGRSIRDAFRWAQCYRYDWLITMDCDDQHEPEALPGFVERIGRGDADLISGSRYLDLDAADTPPPDRRRINATVTDWVNDRLGMSITDAFCGFKAYRVECLKDLKLDVDGYALPLQQWVQHAAAEHRVIEAPVRLIYNDPNRTFGGHLDDAAVRLEHYREVFEAELAKHPERFPATDAAAELAASSGPCVCRSRA
jgi:dolichol-phosphate mannosyltransferase